MTDAEVAALPRSKPMSIVQQVVEKVLGKPLCDQCHRRQATCTVPIFDVGHFPGATRNYPTAYQKQYWCAECRANVFDHGQEYAWGNDRGCFLKRDKTQ